MGILNKIKDVLFVDVEEEEKTKEDKPIAEKIEPTVSEVPKRDVPKRETPKVETPQVEETPRREVSREVPRERELFKVENTSPFIDFDEDEFDNITRLQNTQKPKSNTNVLEYEKKKTTTKRTDYGRVERIEKTEVVERKKFKPSPIISPVYGILNEDYKVEDIKDVTEQNKLDVNEVRNKAFAEILNEEPKTTYSEESTVTVKLKEDEEEKRKKTKTIDELLEDTSDDIINTSEPVEGLEDYLNVDQDLEELNKEEPKVEEMVDEDTLENDLFDLIDSMYETREEGDE